MDEISLLSKNEGEMKEMLIYTFFLSILAFLYNLISLIRGEYTLSALLIGQEVNILTIRIFPRLTQNAHIFDLQEREIQSEHVLSARPICANFANSRDFCKSCKLVREKFAEFTQIYQKKKVNNIGPVPITLKFLGV